MNLILSRGEGIKVMGVVQNRLNFRVFTLHYVGGSERIRPLFFAAAAIFNGAKWQNSLDSFSNPPESIR